MLLTELSLTRFKTCTKCGMMKPATSTFWQRQRAGKYGYTAWCKVCRILIGREYREANRETRAAYNRRYAEEHRDAIAQKRRDWRERNYEYDQEYNRRYREQNREAIAQYGREYREKNAVACAAKNKRWHEANREQELERTRRHYQDNKEHYAERMKRYNQEHPEVSRAAYQRYRGRKREQTGEPYTGRDLVKMYENQKGSCWYCGAHLFGLYHVEHKQPISRGGLDCRSNIVLACPTCNLRKSSKTAEEFLELLATHYAMSKETNTSGAVFPND